MIQWGTPESMQIPSILRSIFQINSCFLRHSKNNGLAITIMSVFEFLPSEYYMSTSSFAYTLVDVPSFLSSVILSTKLL